ncbi:MAG: 30S ribosomal protein S3 [Candidatus Omnitrophica bacterium CG11_big_fil_rev_8_21_14_0_20_45_26]|uniref:Small ribosomal subunit protein uS3 n=1 Tax=Candidatus Abzuiibacterium crystallinum TaxID=1974748 RepID=A0A2H0LN84_9BACT|nr:MAG: 30S ribosomal protein S3 [Candidatus Omnitrophica bacterium CG11_big_fil_rev_8_21_14_0_20_45_26]PIW65103.1 MAG: 30S ribosomal protein S3 [Candidatus Omnitrophica bacterium CG12_big_fil_rev_8_21_14_0_65_45_16]
MGQKSHPYGLRLGYIKNWKSRWYFKKGYREALHEDLKLRQFLEKELAAAGVSSIEIERKSGKVRIQIFTARPGIIIGRRGQEIDRVKTKLTKLTNDQVVLDIKEVKVPQTDAQLVAENIAMQLEKRVAFRKAMKKAVTTAMSKGAGGIKVMCKGRLGGSEIARTEGYRVGKVPLGTFRANVDYGFKQAFTTYGTIGVKIWIYHGDILVKKEQAERQKERERRRMGEAEQQAESTPAAREAHPEVAAASGHQEEKAE